MGEEPVVAAATTGSPRGAPGVGRMLALQRPQPPVGSAAVRGVPAPGGRG